MKSAGCDAANGAVPSLRSISDNQSQISWDLRDANVLQLARYISGHMRGVRAKRGRLDCSRNRPKGEAIEMDGFWSVIEMYEAVWVGSWSQAVRK